VRAGSTSPGTSEHANSDIEPNQEPQNYTNSISTASRSDHYFRKNLKLWGEFFLLSVTFVFPISLRNCVWQPMFEPVHGFSEKFKKKCSTVFSKNTQIYPSQACLSHCSLIKPQISLVNLLQYHSEQKTCKFCVFYWVKLCSITRSQHESLSLYFRCSLLLPAFDSVQTEHAAKFVQFL